MKRLIVLSLFLSLTSGCGTQLQAVKNCAVESCSGLDNNPLSDHPNGPALTWDDIMLDAKISGGVHDREQSLTFNIVDKTILIRIPVSGGAFLGESAVLGSIPGIDSSEVRVYVEGDGGTVILISMNLTDLLAGMSSENQSANLPNGNVLPNFPAGATNYADMEMNASAAVTARIYMGEGRFGIFVETPFNPFIQISFPNKNDSGEVLGYLTQVPAQESFAGGFFMSVVVPDDIKQSIQSLF